ncbi:MOSC domain-containing protein [Alkalihalobacterium chitinilyticum]|uniref:MOSC domain-containing protein n=1 Tax=Alkalihalobacterium chitinilyticum TaxID=2980103 RepID=A0ABT5VKG8_9BACI|nr:MOSC domain-containing protein [Alkalihalobacterium chitinilyticum]MDE5415942.1 MOSC domain-containing protein [Alkalihalobacterium chitinilyticum]
MAMTCMSIQIGKPMTIDHNGKELTTGIYKARVEGSVFIGKLNVEGDGQADLKNHGGKDKAVCVYPYEHYAYWKQDLNKEMTNGAFGENLTVKGMVEKEVYIGDTYKVGDVVVQVSQPRQPCFKLAKRNDVNDLVVRVQETGYTGYYFRVLEEGFVEENDPIELLERHPNAVSVDFANTIMFKEKDNIEGIKAVLALDELSDSWRETLQKRL